MNWINIVQKALNYIEDHLLEDIHAETIAQQVFTSSAYFQRSFSIITGISVGDYIRYRRLSLAGEELSVNRMKVIDAALKYGYESPESFTKAFTRFHGVSPSALRKSACKLNYFAPLNIQINIEGGFIMSRKLIPNVEKLYEIKSENYMFPSCMRSVMAALNEDSVYDFSFFAGISGDFFTQSWLKPEWRYNDSYSNVCKHTLKPIQYAFDACGYEFTYVSAKEIQTNKDQMVKQITDSIDRGLPVLTFGIVGPPVCSIICGYAEEGNVLIGWSQFTGETIDDEIIDQVSSENYFQVRNGLDQSEALIFIGRKKEQPSISECYQKAIQNIEVLAELKSTDEILLNKDAFDAWADSLLEDKYFENEGMLAAPLDTYQSCVVQTGTNLFYLEDYLKKAAAYCPHLADQINKLSQAFAEEKIAFDKLIDFQGGYFFERDRKALLDKEFRKTLSEYVRKVGEYYQKALSSISKQTFDTH